MRWAETDSDAAPKDLGLRDPSRSPSHLESAGIQPLTSWDEILKQAIAFERSGEWESAGRAYETAFQTAARAVRTTEATDALRGQARLFRQRGEYEKAEELAELSRTIAELNGLGREAARAMNILALIHYSQKNWSGARSLYTVALDSARDVGDDELIGLACQNLGVLANILGDLREARALYLESIGSSVRSGDKMSEVMAYNNLGIVCSDLEEWIEAIVYFDRGIEIAERAEIRPLLAKLFVNRARPLIRIGELNQALDSLDRAERLGEETDDSVVLSEAARHRGVLLELEGDSEGARAHLTRALAIASESRLGLERAEALCELAQLDRKEGRTGAAVVALREARELYLSLGAERDAARAEETLEEWERTRDPVPLRPSER